MCRYLLLYNACSFITILLLVHSTNGHCSFAFDLRRRQPCLGGLDCIEKFLLVVGVARRALPAARDRDVDCSRELAGKEFADWPMNTRSTVRPWLAWLFAT